MFHVYNHLPDKNDHLEININAQNDRIIVYRNTLSPTINFLFRSRSSYNIINYVVENIPKFKNNIDTPATEDFKHILRDGLKALLNGKITFISVVDEFVPISLCITFQI